MMFAYKENLFSLYNTSCRYRPSDHGFRTQSKRKWRVTFIKPDIVRAVPSPVGNINYCTGCKPARLKHYNGEPVIKFQ